ncbi:MAG: IS200/IS605 family transposase [Lewinellaceae bacterium]|nr:IS200/IS605 family transposase [Lewinellaceae bacterium]
MGQSLVQNYLHVTFSTKHRLPLIRPSIESELHAYLGGILGHLECKPITIGGTEDHVHILFLLSQKIALMKVLEEIKNHSSKWIKTKGPEFRQFYWQRGYGAFSVKSQDVETVRQYIANQHDHHRHISFQDEYRRFLQEYQIEYDERYVWD